MIHFRERNRSVVGLISVIVLAVLIVGALEFAKLPLVHSGTTQRAYFANAGGLETEDVVTVHGVKVGQVTGLHLRGDKVEVDFSLQSGVHLGSTTGASAEVLSPIGTEYLQLTSAGPGSLDGPIPLSRTTIPYTLVTDLQDLGSQIQQYDIPQLEKSFAVSSQSLSGTTSAEAAAAFAGLARFSQVLAGEQSQLSSIVTQGASLTQVLSNRSGQLVDLVSQANIVLGDLAQRKAAIEQLLSGTSALGQQLTAIISTNRAALDPLVNTLDTVTAVLAKDADDIGGAMPLLAAFGRYAANSTGSGPFADVDDPTLLLPDNVLAACAPKSAYPSANAQVGCRP